MIRTTFPTAPLRCVAAIALLGAVFSHPLSAQTIAIVGGTVYPVSGPPIQNGTVIIQGGRITAVGAGLPVPANAQRVDATGKWVTPGLINSSTQLGVVEVSGVAETRDAAARGRDAVAASFRVWDGLNSRSVLFAPTRAEGTTSVVVMPQGGLVSGQAAIIDLTPGDASTIVRRAPVAMVAEVGDARAAGTGARGELIGKLRTLLDDVRFYARNVNRYDVNATRALATSRADLEALIPVVEGRLPLLIAADRADDILAALKLASDYKLKIMIGGGAEAWLVADRLASANVPVITGAMNNIPSSFATLNQRQENVAMLNAAGVRVALAGNSGGGDEELFNARNVKYEAGNAVAYGLPRDAALRALTLTPAELFGVADRVGSLQAGRDANVVVWSGDPFEIGTRVERVFVRGSEIREPSRQDLLTERYMSLPAAMPRP